MAAIAQIRTALEPVGSRPGTPGTPLFGEDIHDMAEPMFDHHTYPELIDAILEYAPPESLLVFRGTDRHYRSRVDDMLFEHVIVQPASCDKGKGKESEAKPGLPGCQLLASKPPYRRLPLLPYDLNDEFDRWVLGGAEGERPEATPASQAREDCREDIARRIRVVDLYERPEVPFPFNQAFGDLEIVRRPAVWTSHDEIAFAPIVVDFIDLARRAPGTDGKLHLDPGAATRHVVHVAFVAAGGATAYDEFTYAEPEEPRDLVLVFSTGTSTPTHKGILDKEVFWKLTDLARCTMIAGGTVTYVGVDSIDLGDDTDEVGSKFEKHLQGCLNHEGLTPKGETLEDAMVRVSFVSHDEWRASLAEENIEFEAEWPTFTYE